MVSDTVYILIPIVASIIVGLAIFLRYKKDMAMIKKGINPQAIKEEDNLTAGLILLGIAIGLYFGFYYGFGGFDAYMIAPLVLFFIGIALLLSYWAKTKRGVKLKPKKRTVKKKVKKKTVKRKAKKRK